MISRILFLFLQKKSCIRQYESKFSLHSFAFSLQKYSKNLLESEVVMAGNETREKTKVRKEKLAGYFYNISQLTFTGTGLGGVLPLLKGDVDLGNVSVLIFGIVMTTVFAMAANRVLKY